MRTAGAMRSSGWFFVAALGCATGCGSGSKPTTGDEQKTSGGATSAAGPASATGAASSHAASDADPKLAWVNRPKKKFENSVKSLADQPFAFSIELVDGFGDLATMSDEYGRYYESQKTGGPFSFSVVIHVFDGDLAAKVEVLKKREKLLKQEKTAKGYLIHAEDGNETAAVYRGTKAAQGHVECVGSITAVGGPGKNRDAVLAWLEGMCQSLVVK